MNFKDILRERLPRLVLDNEPEILDELALHLADLYNEGISEGLAHEEALTRALAALPGSTAAFAQEIESASRALPGLIADRWRARDDGFPGMEGSRWSMLAWREAVRRCAGSTTSASTFRSATS